MDSAEPPVHFRLWVANAGLKQLCDLVKQQQPTGPPGRYRLDPAFPEEASESGIASQRV